MCLTCSGQLSSTSQRSQGHGAGACPWTLPGGLRLFHFPWVCRATGCLQTSFLHTGCPNAHHRPGRSAERALPGLTDVVRGVKSGRLSTRQRRAGGPDTLETDHPSRAQSPEDCPWEAACRQASQEGHRQICGSLFPG